MFMGSVPKQRDHLQSQGRIFRLRMVLEPASFLH